MKRKRKKMKMKNFRDCFPRMWFKAKSINTGIDCDVKSDSLRLNWDVYSLKGRSSSIISVYLDHGNGQTIYLFSYYIFLAHKIVRRRRWGRWRRWRIRIWEIVSLRMWFKSKCILMLLSVSHCKKHKYWNRLWRKVRLI